MPISNYCKPKENKSRTSDLFELYMNFHRRLWKLHGVHDIKLRPFWASLPIGTKNAIVKAWKQ
jgi:hypothetical protein